jgi:hypothetical protein
LVTYGREIVLLGITVMKSKIRFVAIIVFTFLCLALPVYAADLTVGVDASSYIRAIPETMYGTNTQCWDGKQNGGNDNYNNLMAASGSRYIRWPGGSWGDAFLWSDMEGPADGNDYTGRVSYDESMYMINKMGAIMQPIVNFPGYWYGIDHNDACAISAAVAWVQDQSSRIPTARYWEIGNEIGGPWEAGYFPEISGVYYGDRYANFYNAMKAINLRIKIGACAEPYDTPAQWGWYQGYWTRDLLTTTDANHGLRPDFLIIHSYPGSTSNSTLLTSDLSLIATFTNNLNAMVSTYVGPQYVGKIKYSMTEWDAGSPSGYNRDITYVSALFKAQYILEMCKYGWESSNPWSQNQYHMSSEGGYPDYYVYPKWYFPTLLNYYFGRDMVTASSTNGYVRAYASRDDANNLTIFMANNYSSTDRTVRINISGFGAASTGQRWLIQPAGSIVPGGVNGQDVNDLMINGVVHPNPSTVPSLSGVSISTSDSFDISLPRSSILIIKIPPANPTTQLPYNGTAWPIPGTIEAGNYDTGGKFVAYYDTTAGNSGGQYRSDDVDIETCSDGGYDVTGIKTGEWLEYTVNVESSGIYIMRARVASADSNGEFRIEFDGQDVTGPVSFPATGDSQTFTNVDVNHVLLSKGQHTMRLLMDANDWNINWINFSKAGGGTGKALLEWWTAIMGGSVAELTSRVNYPYNPTGRALAKSLEGPTNWTNSSNYQMDTYGTRIRGYLNPITSGDYTFWIASNDASELWLSTDADPCHATKIAQVTNSPDYVNPYKWDKIAEQKSAVISLVAGQQYYIEVLHKQYTGGASIAVAWEGPGIIRQAITGAYLAPYVIDFADFSNFANQWLKTGCTLGAGWCSGADNDHDGNVQLDDLMRFIENWWLFGGE